MNKPTPLQFKKTGETIDDFGYICERIEPIIAKANIAPLDEAANYVDGRIIATAWWEGTVVIEFENYGWPNHLYGDKRYMFIGLSRMGDIEQ